ncbi:putative uncharacterized protein DDB_G0282133 [Teleopsis dalmanni]|uniref:putative uncharacterized protein DDB_G0282133 n=1 Tax=Teleopsis dalmanni TaxID=139649 RepID=UPI0018CEA750|nr:putative uncharacterized protein DDB_G0282133 [Teleopsis dalmanni]
MYAIPSTYNAILPSKVLQSTNNNYHAHSSRLNEMQNIESFQKPPLSQMPPVRSASSINYPGVPLNVITKVKDLEKPLNNPLKTLTTPKDVGSNHSNSLKPFSFEPVNMYTYSSKNYDMQLRDPHVRFSHITEPLVRNRVHPLKETAQYKFGNMLRREPPDLRNLFPHDPDVHAPFVRKPKRENSDIMRKIAIRNDTRRNADIYLEYNKQCEDQWNQRFLDVNMPVNNPTGEKLQYFKERNIFDTQNNSINCFENINNDFMQPIPQYQSKYSFLNEVNYIESENVDYLGHNLNNLTNTLNATSTANSFSDGFVMPDNCGTLKRNSQENIATSPPKKSCASATITSTGFDGIREGLFSLNEGYGCLDVQQNMHNPMSCNYINNSTKVSNVESYMQANNSSNSNSSSEVEEIIFDNEKSDITLIPKTYGRLNINSKATNKYKNVESMNENILPQAFDHSPNTHIASSKQISENNINKVCVKNIDSLNNSNDSNSENHYTLPSVRDFNNFRSNFANTINSANAIKNSENILIARDANNFKNPTEMIINSGNKIQNLENISNANILNVRNINTHRTNTETIDNSASKIQNLQVISDLGNKSYVKNSTFKNNENTIPNSTDISPIKFLKNIDSNDNFNSESSNGFRHQYNINRADNFSFEFNNGFQLQNNVNSADNINFGSNNFFQLQNNINRPDNNSFGSNNGLQLQNKINRVNSNYFGSNHGAQLQNKINRVNNNNFGFNNGVQLQNNIKRADNIISASTNGDLYKTVRDANMNSLRTNDSENEDSFILNGLKKIPDYSKKFNFSDLSGSKSALNNSYFNNSDTSLAVANSATSVSSGNIYDGIDDGFNKNVKLFELMLQEG